MPPIDGEHWERHRVGGVIQAGVRYRISARQAFVLGWQQLETSRQYVAPIYYGTPWDTTGEAAVLVDIQFRTRAPRMSYEFWPLGSDGTTGLGVGLGGSYSSTRVRGQATIVPNPGGPSFAPSYSTVRGYGYHGYVTLSLPIVRHFQLISRGEWQSLDGRAREKSDGSPPMDLTGFALSSGIVLGLP